MIVRYRWVVVLVRLGPNKGYGRVVLVFWGIRSVVSDRAGHEGRDDQAGRRARHGSAVIVDGATDETASFGGIANHCTPEFTAGP